MLSDTRDQGQRKRRPSAIYTILIHLTTTMPDFNELVLEKISYKCILIPVLPDTADMFYRLITHAHVVAEQRSNLWIALQKGLVETRNFKIQNFNEGEEPCFLIIFQNENIITSTHERGLYYRTIRRAVVELLHLWPQDGFNVSWAGARQRICFNWCYKTVTIW